MCESTLKKGENTTSQRPPEITRSSLRDPELLVSSVPQRPLHRLSVYHGIKLRLCDKLANYTYSISTHSPTVLTHTVHGTLPTQCGNVDKDDQCTQSHTEHTVHKLHAHSLKKPAY